MLIGVDGNEANTNSRVGIGEYAYQLLLNFYRLREAGKFSDLSFFIYLKDQPRKDLPEQTGWWQYKIVVPKKLWTQVGLPIKLFTSWKKPDVFFSPTHYAPRFSPVPTAISIMDLSYLRFPELFAKHDLYQLIHWTKYSAQNAKKIFTISKSSKDDIITAYHVPDKHIVVTYPGIKHEFEDMKKEINKIDLQQKFGIVRNYILFVGTLQPRKNISRLIEAFALLKKKKKERSLQLVIVGKKGWFYEDILAAPERNNIAKDVLFLNFVSDEDLPTLYSHALCYVLPSLYEGFGLPVLEAMKYGCPVITSNVSSLPEAGGDAALYVDPKDVQDIADKMSLVIENKSLRNEMVQKGYEHLEKFSWERTAKQTLTVLEELGRS